MIIRDSKFNDLKLQMYFREYPHLDFASSFDMAAAGNFDDASDDVILRMLGEQSIQVDNYHIYLVDYYLNARKTPFSEALAPTGRG